MAAILKGSNPGKRTAEASYWSQFLESCYFFTLDGVILFQTELAHSLGFILGLWLLLKEKCLCTNSSFVPIAPILGGLADIHSCPGYFLISLLHYALHGTAFEDHPKVISGRECSSTSNSRHPAAIARAGDSVYFYVQFNLLVISFKNMNVTGPGSLQKWYLCGYLSIPTKLDKMDMLQVRPSPPP